MMYEDALVGVLNRVYRNIEDRQIPKKPIYEGYYYICPRCRDDLGVSDDDIFIYELSMPKYCSNCGCVLDWTEVKNERLY